MQEPKDIASRLQTGSPESPERPRHGTASEAGLSALPDALRRKLWVRMAEIYGHRWTSAYGDDSEGGAALTWAKGLAGLSPQQIGDGVTAALASADPWPPTLPEFRRMCFDIPTLAQVRYEVRPGQDATSPFARLVWSYLDSYQFRNVHQDKADRILAEAYELAVEHVMRGGELPEPSVALAPPVEPKPVPARPEVVAEAIANLRKLYGAPESEGQA